MKELSKKDGFCRAPRVEMISEGNGLEEMTFEQMMKTSSCTMDSDENLNVVRNLARGDR